MIQAHIRFKVVRDPDDEKKSLLRWTCPRCMTEQIGISRIHATCEHCKTKWVFCFQYGCPKCGPMKPGAKWGDNRLCPGCGTVMKSKTLYEARVNRVWVLMGD